MEVQRASVSFVDESVQVNLTLRTQLMPGGVGRPCLELGQLGCSVSTRLVDSRQSYKNRNGFARGLFHLRTQAPVGILDASEARTNGVQLLLDQFDFTNVRDSFWALRSAAIQNVSGPH